MPFAPTTSAGSGPPFVKFAEIGDTFVGAYAGGKNRQQREYKTGDPRFKDDGRPMLEELMYFVAMPGTTAVTGNLEAGETSPITEGETVRYAVKGWQWGQVIEARKGLPAAFGFKAGQTCSSDVYTFTVTGFSASTENAGAAKQAGFSVVEGRIVMSTEAEHEKWVLAQAKRGANANAAKEFTVTVRRCDDTTEKNWMQHADEVYSTKPWDQAVAAVGPGPFDGPTFGGVTAPVDIEPEEPF